MCSWYVALTVFGLPIEAWAQVFGAASGGVLLIPAFAANRLLADTAALQEDIRKLPENQDRLRQIGERTVERLGTSSATWRRRDDHCLKLGLALLIASFAAQFLLVLCR